MTAQVAILNSDIAVLASDSASSISNSGKYKIFKSIPKIFKLADNIPVAVMISGYARFVNISWSRIIDLYNKNGQIEKNHLEDHYHEFVKHIEENKNLMSYDQNITFISGWTHTNYLALESQIATLKLDRSGIAEWFNIKTDQMKKLENFVLDESKLDVISGSISSYLEAINSAKFTRDTSLIHAHNKDIIKYLSLLFVKQIDQQGRSNIVIAGFGSDDIFPSLINFQIAGLFENKLRVSEPKIRKLGGSFARKRALVSTIIPFAQAYGAEIFLDGISSETFNFLTKQLNHHSNTVKNFLKDNPILSELDEDKRHRLIKDFFDLLEGSIDNIKSSLISHSRNKYTRPISESVSYMGETDVAELARTLVNLTSIKLRYSIDEDETVGGSTDVVLLTKERGFEKIEQKALK